MTHHHTADVPGQLPQHVLIRDGDTEYDMAAYDPIVSTSDFVHDCAGYASDHEAEYRAMYPDGDGDEVWQ